MNNSPLALLPPEVRNRIYALALTKPGQVRIKHPPPAWKKDPAIQPPLTRVCRQIRFECLLMFYARNTFVIEIDVQGDWSDQCPKTRKQLKMSQRWVERTKGEYHRLIGKMHIELYAKHGERVYPGNWYGGVSWRLNHRRWEDLIDALLHRGYARKDISVCVFGKLNRQDGQWFEKAFRDAGVWGGIEWDSRILGKEGDGFEGELEVEGSLAGLPRASSGAQKTSGSELEVEGVFAGLPGLSDGNVEEEY